MSDQQLLTPAQISEIKTNLHRLSKTTQYGCYERALYRLPKKEQDTVLRMVANLRDLVYCTEGQSISQGLALATIAHMGMALW